MLPEAAVPAFPSARLVREMEADDDLRQAVEKLLQADARGGDPLREAIAPALDRAVAADLVGPTGKVDSAAPLGPYRIVERLGEGGE